MRPEGVNCGPGRPWVTDLQCLGRRWGCWGLQCHPSTLRNTGVTLARVWMSLGQRWGPCPEPRPRCSCICVCAARTRMYASASCACVSVCVPAVCAPGACAVHVCAHVPTCVAHAPCERMCTRVCCVCRVSMFTCVCCACVCEGTGIPVCACVHLCKCEMQFEFPGKNHAVRSRICDRRAALFPVLWLVGGAGWEASRGVTENGVFVADQGALKHAEQTVGR